MFMLQSTTELQKDARSILDYGVQQFAEDIWTILPNDSSNFLFFFHLSSFERRFECLGETYTLFGLMKLDVADIRFAVSSSLGNHIARWKWMETIEWEGSSDNRCPQYLVSLFHIQIVDANSGRIMISQRPPQAHRNHHRTVKKRVKASLNKIIENPFKSDKQCRALGIVMLTSAKDHLTILVFYALAQFYS